MLQQLTYLLRKLKLRTSVNLVLSITFITGIIISGVVLGFVLNNQAQGQITAEARVLLKTIDEIRNYTENQIRPELERVHDEFLPQTIPSYAARETFENLRKDDVWGSYFYKEATLNPTNLRDKADDFESGIIETFRQKSNLMEQAGFENTRNGKLFYLAHPITITQASCLECHSTPDVAPASMIARYGDVNGFGWQMNETVGAKILYVPAGQILQKARQYFFLIMGIFTAILCLTTVLINQWLRQFVVSPITRITKIADAISTGDLKAEFEEKFSNEIGSLAAAFTRMKTSLVIAMERLQKYRS